MKIAVLTQPLHDNYGGLLQAYALKEVLQDLGHEVVIINRWGNNSDSKLSKLKTLVKSILLNGKTNPKILLSKSQKEIISKETASFREKYIPNLSSLITDNKGMNNLNRLGFDAYVVGSDQCWRPHYSPNIRNFFLDFVNDNDGIRRLSYAASFGVSKWEFNEADTLICKELLQKFDGISVREHSGIGLIKKYLGRNDAVHVVDPTMLLSINKYMKIVSNENIPNSEGEINVYILDKTASKEEVVHQVASITGYHSFEVLPKRRLGSEKVTDKNVDDFAYPNPAKWIKGFQDAKFVITDSFHGTVFSILFNKPFITIGNANRGMARFESLLNMFDLKNRLIIDYSVNAINNILKSAINWENVNNILEDEQDKAINFIRKNLE